MLYPLQFIVTILTGLWGAGLGSHQSPLPSYQGDYELMHHKIIPVPFRQPSTVFQPTGAAREADHVEPGSVPSSLTCNRPTLASTRRGFTHKIVPNGVQLWRRLCSPLGVPPDDDDDDEQNCDASTLCELQHYWDFQEIHFSRIGTGNCWLQC